MKILTPCLLGLLALLTDGMIAATVPTEPPAQILLRAGEGSYHTYRIPALVAARDGVLVLLLEGRKDAQDDFAAIDLLCLRSRDEGRTWSRPQVVYSEGPIADRISIGNPCPVVDAETGRLWCSFTKDNQQVYVTYSDDAGATWAPPREITRDVRPIEWTRYWTGPGHGLQLRHGPKKGRLIFPSYHMLLEAREGGHSTAFVMRSHMIYSDDHGTTWKIGAGTQVSPELATPESRFSGKWIPGEAEWHGCECMAAELPDGRLYLTIRDNAGIRGVKGEAYSSDGGETWSPVKAQPQLPEPRCQAALLRWEEPGQSGKSMLLYTGITLDTRLRARRFQPAPGVQGRQRLAAYLSEDDGRTWREAGVAFPRAAAYSDLVALPGGDVLCVFEGGEKGTYESIRLMRLHRDWLRGKTSTP